MRSLIKHLFLFAILSLFLSCSTKQKDGLFTISVESAEKSTLSLSEISENIEAIELESTDNSLLFRIEKVCYTEEYIVIQGGRREHIWLFNKQGKFLRKIGSVGQGPGEYVSVNDVTVDTKNKQIIVTCSNCKYICYNFEGKLIKESVNTNEDATTNCIYYIDDKQYNLIEVVVFEKDGSRINKTVLYTIDSNMLRTDSLVVRKLPSIVFRNNPKKDFINNDGINSYLYFPDNVPPELFATSPYPFVPDTLYQLKNMELIPYLQIKGLVSAGNRKNVLINNIYKSFRYVFCTYSFYGETTVKQFCYDLRTGKSFDNEDGFVDDIHTREKVIIRPFWFDSNMFYYLHTSMKPDDIKEPNPTLYIGRLKK